jgi:WD40 repeat protein
MDDVKFSRDDKYIFSGSENEECVRIWNLKSGAKEDLFESLEEGQRWLFKYPEMRILAEK